MFNLTDIKRFKRMPSLFAAVVILLLTGCELENSSDTEGTGYIQIYNASPNAPGVIVTLGKNDDDDYEDYSSLSVNYPIATGFIAHNSGTFDMDLSWQSGDDSDELEVLFEDQLEIVTDELQLIVVSDDIATLDVQIYNIPIEDDDSDDTDELFNLRVLNMHSTREAIDIYYSRSDESFNEAVLFNAANYAILSDNEKIAEDDYVFYITYHGINEVIYQSDEISFVTAYQYLLVVRENTGAGSSPFVIDKLSSTNSAVEFPDADAEAELRVYNGIVEHELLPSYLGNIDIQINGIDMISQIESLPFGQFSDPSLMTFGDYSVSLNASENTQNIIKNHLLSLPANSDKTVFFYLNEKPVDEDGDGDYDEDGDGYVDQYEITVNSLVVENSQSQSIYSHQVNVINLIDDFTSVRVYFVRSDETIDSSYYSVTANYIKPNSKSLPNNTYKVYLIGQEDSSELILASQELIIDESMQAQFLVLEESTDSPSGYKMTFHDQKVE